MQDNTPFYYKGYKSQATPQAPAFWTNKICSSPKSIFSHLDKYAYGHCAYKKKLAYFIYQAYNRKRPGSILVCGPSGTGKTEMLRIVESFYPNRKISQVDCTSLSSAAYKGNNKINSSFRNLDISSKGPLSIMCFDEIDKLIQRADGGNNDSAPLWELLKVLEGESIDVTSNSNEPPELVDTSNVCFILLGSFSYLTPKKKHMQIGFARSDETDPAQKLNRDIVLEQIPPELRGRIEDVVFLDEFTEEDFKNIIKNKQAFYCPVKRIEREYNINLSLSDEKATQIAHKAFIEKTGLRAINSELSSYVKDVLFDNPNVKEIIMEV